MPYIIPGDPKNEAVIAAANRSRVSIRVKICLTYSLVHRRRSRGGAEGTVAPSLADT